MNRAEKLENAYKNAIIEARESGAARLDEYIPDTDDKVEIYRLGANDMLEDFIGFYNQEMKE
jgi:hypothetical protein